MNHPLALEIANAAQTLNVALEEIQMMASRGQGGVAMQELLRHAREMCEILAELVSQLGDEPLAPGAQAMAIRLSAELEALERDIAGKPLH
jgi:hypothetical protein